MSGQLFIAGFFSVHYGMLTFVHGVFLFMLFGSSMPSIPGFVGDLKAIRQVLLPANVELPLLLLALSHLFSFFGIMSAGGNIKM